MNECCSECGEYGIPMIENKTYCTFCEYTVALEEKLSAATNLLKQSVDIIKENPWCEKLAEDINGFLNEIESYSNLMESVNNNFVCKECGSQLYFVNDTDKKCFTCHQINKLKSEGKI